MVDAAPMVVSSQPFLVQMDVDIGTWLPDLTIGFDLGLADGTIVFRTYQTDADPEMWPELHVGRNRLECEIGSHLLNDGRYTVFPRIGIDRSRWIVDEGAVPSTASVTGQVAARPGPEAGRAGAAARLAARRRDAVSESGPGRRPSSVSPCCSRPVCRDTGLSTVGSWPTSFLVWAFVWCRGGGSSDPSVATSPLLVDLERPARA